MTRSKASSIEFELNNAVREGNLDKVKQLVAENPYKREIIEHNLRVALQEGEKKITNYLFKRVGYKKKLFEYIQNVNYIDRLYELLNHNNIKLTILDLKHILEYGGIAPEMYSHILKFFEDVLSQRSYTLEEYNDLLEFTGNNQISELIKYYRDQYKTKL